MQLRTIADLVRDQKVLTLPETSTVREAARAMRDRRVGCVLIASGGSLEGIFTERDLVGRVVAEGRDPDGTRLAEVMTKGPDTIGPAATAIDALRRMQDGGYRHLPVVEGGKLLGIVSQRDFLGEEQARLNLETGLWERI